MSLLTMAGHGDQSSICSLDLSVLSGQDINAPTVQPRDARFGYKVGQIGPKWDKSDMKKPRICPICGQSDPLWSQTYHPWRRLTSTGLSE